MNTVPVWSVDARSGAPAVRVTVETATDAVDRAVRAAQIALPALADRRARAALLRAAAERLEARGPELIAAADRETALGTPRLTGELARAAYQFRAFADAVDEGAFLDVVIDHADPQAAPAPRPDLRRWKVPLGVVAVFAASNFPFAFSVPGGDTASALAAGCPVVAKAHPDHPQTSELAAEALREAAESVGLPAAVLALVHGRQAGVDLVQHPLIAAAGFTGSIPGGRALYDLAAARPVPIPFHGELGSLNPVVVTERAADARAEEIGSGLGGSFTLGMGQFCTKPGLVLVPAGAAGDRLEQALAAAAGQAPAGALLDARMRAGFLEGFAERAALPGVDTPVAAGEQRAEGLEQGVRPGYLSLPAALLAQPEYRPLLEECFGPVTVVARYQGPDEVAAVLARLGGNLTATLHAEPDEPDAAALLERLTPLAGRILFGGWPTGVAVAPAMHHGGPYPATTGTGTSVGGTAVDRWLRPVVYQNTPQQLLPPELHDANPLGIPRRLDGALQR
ncbi:aldehyde dehydrogenase family protein [Streptacidiphilus sp. PB12-B1b]|uniref:aldehyde dehydrogenase family protein n=1 Tax=Streptacidiphilus sp. PB12-B1b TaxID=2705012 RepID=UPI0015FB82E6|nr:aldehyde dehydrogenase family protein [Streptacidiphilus sp. PB12-B1b]QMU78572.1 aldehyde dehydrogenase family protein [Streptacidiphilus sp. PB12-B1b]